MAAVAENANTEAPEAPETTTAEELPTLPPRMNKPDKFKYEGIIDELNNEIDSIKLQRSNLLKRIKASQNGGSAFREAKDKARKTMSAFVKVKNGIMAERKALFNQRDAIRASTDRLREMGRNMKGSLGNFNSVGDIDRKIKQLHERQNTTNMSLRDEKDLIKQIDQLTSMKKTVASFSAHNEKLRAEADSGKGLATLISEKNKALKEIGEKIVAAKKTLEAIEKKQNSSTADVTPLREKLDELKGVQEKKIALIREKRKNWKVINDEYYEYVLELRKVKAIIRKAEDEAWAKEKEQRRIEYEAELAKQKPWLAEIAMCDLLSNYLKELLPKQAAPEAEDKPAAKTNSVAKGFEGLRIMKKKGDDEAEYARNNTRGKKKRKKLKKQKMKQQRDKDLIHTFDTIANFSELKSKSKIDVIPPSCTEDIPDTLDALQKVRDHFDTLPRPVVKKAEKKEKVPKTMSTEFGEGSVVEKRSDGVRIVKLSWATLYTSQK